MKILKKIEVPTDTMMIARTETKRLNIHFSRMGEPTFNEAVLAVAYNIGSRRASLNFASGTKAEVIHPVVSTMMSKNNKHLLIFLQKWVSIKNNLYRGDTGLQFNINSTDETQRKDISNNIKTK